MHFLYESDCHPLASVNPVAPDASLMLIELTVLCCDLQTGNYGQFRAAIGQLQTVRDFFREKACLDRRRLPCCRLRLPTRAAAADPCCRPVLPVAAADAVPWRSLQFS